MVKEEFSFTLCEESYCFTSFNSVFLSLACGPKIAISTDFEMFDLQIAQYASLDYLTTLNFRD